MVKSIIMEKNREQYKNPNLFHAAFHNDVAEMRLALDSGQSLNDSDADMGFTPVHIACMQRSVDFLQEAVKHEFDPWIRDINLRLAIDHAAAIFFRDGQRILYDKMYPPGWGRAGAVISLDPS